MEIRGKKCLTCGEVTGLMNDSCEECDSDRLVLFTQVAKAEAPFWGLTVSKEIDNSKAVFEFEEAILGSTKKWRGYYDGHGVTMKGIPGVDAEISLMELHWYFNEDEGHPAVDLQRTLFGLRPGLMGEASISVTFFDTIEVGEED